MKKQLTVDEMLAYAVQQFEVADLYYGHGSCSALDDAAALLLHALKLPVDCSLEEVAERVLTEAECRYIYSIIERRVKERIPLPYLTKQAWFAGLSFYVDQRVLIPRSPIAELVEARFEPWIDYDQVSRIVDIGTGSGCLAISCAIAFPNSLVDAVDIDRDSLCVAKINIDNHQLSSRVRPCYSNLLTHLRGQRYDIIIANPPYVDQSEIADLPVEYHYEPQGALVSADGGLWHAKEIIKQAYHHLTDHGILVVEVGDKEELLQNSLPKIPFIWLDFQFGGDGVFLLTKSALQKHNYVL